MGLSDLLSTGGRSVVGRERDFGRRRFAVDGRFVALGYIELLSLRFSVLDDRVPIDLHVDVMAHGNLYHGIGAIKSSVVPVR